MKKLWLLTSFALCLGTSSAMAADKPIELTFSTYLPSSYEYVWKPMQTFIETVEAESDGKVKIKFFHSGQLFDGYDELQALSGGDIDISNMTGVYMSGTVPAMNVFLLPFLFQDTPHLRRALDAGLMDIGITQELHDKQDVVVLGVAPWDPYEFYTRKAPIKSAADVKGKVWATTGAIDAQGISLLGGSPTGMASSELYLAFDRGVIDGTVRPLLTGIGRSLFEVTKYLSLATFDVDVNVLAINREKWESLPEDVQALLKKAAKQRDDEQFQMVQDFVKEAIGQYESKGVEVNRIEESELEAMREATKPAIAEWVGNVENGQQYLDLVNKVRNP